MSPAPPATAEAVLQRLLLVLPLAARNEGASVEELARELGVDPRRILRDLKELEDRAYYLPPGLGDQFQIRVTRDWISVWTTREFRRPVRLGPREALALELALRVAGRPPERPPDPGGKDSRGTRPDQPDGDPSSAGLAGRTPPFEEVRRRLVEAVRTPNAEDVEDPAVLLSGVEGDDDPVRTRVEGAVREGREIRIVYRAPGREPGPRRVGPLVLAHAEGEWYLVARDLEQGGHRAFRLDRVLEATPTETRFTPTDEDREAETRFFRDGRIHDGGGPDALEPFEALVEYAPGIARWIEERGWEDAERLDDGALRVRHRVVDPEWLLRHVLSYGAEARVVEPEWARERVKEAVLRLAD